MDPGVEATPTCHRPYPSPGIPESIRVVAAAATTTVAVVLLFQGNRLSYWLRFLHDDAINKNAPLFLRKTPETGHRDPFSQYKTKEKGSSIHLSPPGGFFPFHYCPTNKSNGIRNSTLQKHAQVWHKRQKERTKGSGLVFRVYGARIFNFLPFFFLNVMYPAHHFLFYCAGSFLY